MSELIHKIEDLSDPSKYNDPIDVSGYDADFLLELLETMLIIRLSEEKLAKERKTCYWRTGSFKRWSRSGCGRNCK